MSRFLPEAAAAAASVPSVVPLLSAARACELIERIRSCGVPLLDVDTFRSGLGAFYQVWRVPGLRRQLANFLKKQHVDAVVVLMSHIWTPLIAGSIKHAGIPYIVVVHDATKHPGDLSGRILGWLLRDLVYADRIIVLSRVVADLLVKAGKATVDRVTVLFHPEFDVALGEQQERKGPLRALFLGRIMDYKGLPLFVKALELLQESGIEITASVVGEGDMEPYRMRLLACGTHVDNRWLDNDEIDRVMANHDVVVLSHTEASQSGVAALAFGAGLPVIATPVGGLREQVRHGIDGLLAERVDARAIADTLQRVALDSQLLAQLRAGVREGRADRSMARFIEEVVKVCIDASRTSSGSPRRRGLRSTQDAPSA